MSVGKKVFLWVLGIVVAIAIFIAFVPAILSTGWGNQVVLRFMPDNVTFKELSLTWFGPQEAREVSVTGRFGLSTATIEEVTLERALLPLIFGDRYAGSLSVTQAQLTAPGVNMTLPHLTIVHPKRGGPLTIKGEGSVNDRPFDIDLDVKEFDHTRPLAALRSATGRWVSPNLPVEALDRLLGLKDQVTELIGATANLDLELSPSEAMLTLQSSKLNLPRTLFSTEDRLTLKEPTTLTYEGLQLKLEKLDIPYDDWRKGSVRAIVTSDDLGLELAVDEGQLTGTIARKDLIANFTGRFTNKGAFEFTSPVNLRYTVQSDQLLKPFDIDTIIAPSNIELKELSLKGLNLKGKYTTTEIDLPDGTLSDVQGTYSLNIPANKATLTLNSPDKAKIDLSLSNFYQNGQINWKVATLIGTAQLDDFPVSALTLFADTPQRAEQFRALLGKQVDLDATARLNRMQGPLQIDLTSGNTHANVRAHIADGALTLTAPLEAKITVTPAVGAHVLADFNPLFANTVRSDQPITLRIDPQGFRLTPQVSGLQIGRAALNPGKLWVKNTGSIRQLFSLFKHSQLNEQKEVQVWSTPIYFSAKNGLLSYHRADILIGTSLQLAFWGRANLNNNALSMTLAIPGYTLRKILGIKDIPNDRYLLIPVRGTLDTPKVDYSTATPRIAALLARKEGAAGKALGAIIEAAAGPLTTDVPPPNTQPFPWANDPTYRAPPAEKPTTDAKKEAAKKAGKQLKKLLK